LKGEWEAVYLRSLFIQQGEMLGIDKEFKSVKMSFYGYDSDAGTMETEWRIIYGPSNGLLLLIL